MMYVCRLLKRCEKPDRKEFSKVARLTAIGFLAVGFLGFVVKLIFIPINQASPAMFALSNHLTKVLHFPNKYAASLFVLLQIIVTQASS